MHIRLTIAINSKVLLNTDYSTEKCAKECGYRYTTRLTMSINCKNVYVFIL